MEAAHRKIELQAPEDLSYLLTNVRRAAAARIDEAFPPVDGAHGEDELRTRIEELVNEYITNTFTLASPNLSINGLPVEPAHFLLPAGSSSTSADPSLPEEVYEPFDGRKRARVEDLSREEEDLLRDIALLKRGVPAAAAAAWAEAARRGVRADEEALGEVNERAVAAASAAVAHPTTTSGADAEAGDGDSGGSSGTDKNKNKERAGKDGDNAKLSIKELERQQDVERSYESAVQGLGRLKREMPSVVARMERARGAGEYVVTER